MKKPSDHGLVQRRISRRDVDEYAHLTDDFNPIHVDDDYAAQTAFGRTIVHGTLTLSVIWDLISTLKPDTRFKGMHIDVRFTAPVPVGETVTAVAENEAADAWRVVVSLPDGRAAVTALVTMS